MSQDGIRVREIVALLRDAAGEDDNWADQVGGASRLDGDLWLDSVELATLDGLLRERYGNRVDLLGFLAGLDLDELDLLTVHDLVNLVEQP